MNQRSKSIVNVSLGILWLTICVAGLLGLTAYENKPEESGHGIDNLPALGLPVAHNYTLVVSIHPQCPCTQATLSELAIVLTHCPELQVNLLFVKPPNLLNSWVKAELWSIATRLPRTTLIVDEGGKKSSALDARTSGQAYLFDKLGHLVYQGGLTGSRGHVGENEGVNSIISIINGTGTTAIKSSVFGCPLFAQKLSQPRGN